MANGMSTSIRYADWRKRGAVKRIDYIFHRGSHVHCVSGENCNGIENRCIDVYISGKALAHLTEYSGWVWQCVPTDSGLALGIPDTHAALMDIITKIDSKLSEHDA